MPKFEKGDVLGCGINFFKRHIFFTYNGKYYGPVFTDIEIRDFYPTVGILYKFEFNPSLIILCIARPPLPIRICDI